MDIKKLGKILKWMYPRTGSKDDLMVMLVRPKRLDEHELIMRERPNDVITYSQGCCEELYD